MRCQNYILKRGEVVMCSREHTYEVRDSSGKVLEYLCTQHAERIVHAGAFASDVVFVYTKLYKDVE
jgi:hypothetical protein